MIETVLKENAGLTLLIAPPAWGKTQLLKKLFADTSQQFIFISPLRALANEFYENLRQEREVINIEKYSDWTKLTKTHQIIIVTPELIQEYQLDKMKRLNITIILDEFHLYFYWGISFREEMWRVMIDLCTLNKKILALTATMSQLNLNVMKEQFANFSQSISVLNLGNQTLKNKPKKICYIPQAWKETWKSFVTDDGALTALIFCQFRREVNQLEIYYRQLGFNVLSCLGGEAAAFSQKLKNNPSPQIIIATTVLSHGVNLPPISKVIFTYPVKNEDFWIQMVGRGGRQGEEFMVITYDDFLLNRWLKLRSFFTILKMKANYHLSWD